MKIFATEGHFSTNEILREWRVLSSSDRDPSLRHGYIATRLLGQSDEWVCLMDSGVDL
ncbi:hypothetical protein [Deinococcus sp. Arct2-2]|uniref:hypothetical protein n=1 Tax=Deinococcus sp. Arct2-2 TaxID=2568653 RepID=UPI001454CA5B|nr:hypothetical protein [Deinococcus sp. Arct2-2]